MRKARRVLVTGDREWKDYDLIYKTLKEEMGTSTNYFILIHGAARGADSHADLAGKRLGYWVMSFTPSKKYWPASGPIRNKWMLDVGNPDRAFAFHDNIAKSKGTRDMVAKLNARGIRTTLVSHGGKVEYHSAGLLA